MRVAPIAQGLDLGSGAPFFVFQVLQNGPLVMCICDSGPALLFYIRLFCKVNNMLSGLIGCFGIAKFQNKTGILMLSTDSSTDSQNQSCNTCGVAVAFHVPRSQNTETWETERR